MGRRIAIYQTVGGSSGGGTPTFPEIAWGPTFGPGNANDHGVSAMLRCALGDPSYSLAAPLKLRLAAALSNLSEIFNTQQVQLSLGTMTFGYQFANNPAFQEALLINNMSAVYALAVQTQVAFSQAVILENTFAEQFALAFNNILVLENAFNIRTALTIPALAVVEPSFQVRNKLNGQVIELYLVTGNISWVCPGGVTSIAIELWAGGGGGGFNNINGGGGGGGGAFSKTNAKTVSTAGTYNLQIGIGGAASNNGGDSVFWDGAIGTGTIVTLAKAGLTGATGTPTAQGAGGSGGSAAAGGGDVKTNGGAGGGSGGVVTNGGGGGGSGDPAFAGPAGNSNGTGGAAGANHGGGGTGATASAAGTAGTQPGGGGGGAGGLNTGTSGAAGMARITYTIL